MVKCVLCGCKSDGPSTVQTHTWNSLYHQPSKQGFHARHADSHGSAHAFLFHRYGTVVLALFNVAIISPNTLDSLLAQFSRYGREQMHRLMPLRSVGPCVSGRLRFQCKTPLPIRPMFGQVTAPK
ncbi:hypothetical protein ACJQWK_11435 [Exserohilum turcicum]